MYKALVLGSDARICLAVVRSLGRGGVDVHVAGHEPDPLLLRSRYLARFHHLPGYEHSGTAWCDQLRALLAQRSFDLVIPCAEPETIACHNHRSVLEKCVRIYLPSPAAVDVLFDKVKTARLARSLGVPVPRELTIARPEEADEVVRAFGFPLVLKPQQSVARDEPGLIRRVRKAYNAAELRDLLPGLLATGPIAVQENFVGIGIGVELLLDAGEPLLAFEHVRVHEPMHGGPSSYRKSAPVSPDLLEGSLKIFRALKYTGVAMAEFKVNARDWVFLEVNARFWGSLPLAVAAGADFPLALFQRLVEGRRSFGQSYRPGIHCRNWTLDLDWQQANLRADHADPTLATRPLRKVLADALWNFLTLRERSDTFALDDPGPGIAEMCELLRRLGTKTGKLILFPGRLQSVRGTGSLACSG